MSPIINPEYLELREQVALSDKEIAELRCSIQKLDQLAKTLNRRSALQIAGIAISFFLTMAGSLYYQTTTLDRRIEGLGKGTERVERNLDYLNKELHTQRQAPK